MLCTKNTPKNVKTGKLELSYLQRRLETWKKYCNNKKEWLDHDVIALLLYTIFPWIKTFQSRWWWIRIFFTESDYVRQKINFKELSACTWICHLFCGGAVDGDCNVSLPFFALFTLLWWPTPLVYIYNHKKCAKVFAYHLLPLFEVLVLHICTRRKMKN